MLKREELERIVEAEKECAEITSLEDAAPKLALACLEARDALVYAVSHLALDDGVPYERELQIVEAALAAAGVEVEP